MKKTAILAAMLWAMAILGCAAAPSAPERVEDEEIRKNAEKSMEDLSQEKEDTRRSGEHY